MDLRFQKSFNLKFPLVVAPMFLVSNVRMMQSAMDAGVMGVFPTLNYRAPELLADTLSKLNQHLQTGVTGSYGVNLIVQKTNIYKEKHLSVCAEHKVPFYITSLGDPAFVIEAARSYGGKVYCDVTNMKHADKCAALGCDGFIAVCSGAGGHAGPYPAHILVPALQKQFPEIPVLAAGGISNGKSVAAMMTLGAAGVSVGTRFIACDEAEVSDAYKEALVKARFYDIVMTDKLSGTPSSVIITPELVKAGLNQGPVGRYFNEHKFLRKYYKLYLQLRGISQLKDSMKIESKHKVWSAGQSVEFIDQVLPLQEIVDSIKLEYEKTLAEICSA